MIKIENGLIPVYENERQEKLVDGRELHEFLESKQEFTSWVKNRIEKYGFIEGEDFLIILSKTDNGRPRTDYILKLDCAKEIAMVENNEKGRQVRRYFIEVEQKYKQQLQTKLPQSYLEALKELVATTEEKEQLKLKIEQDKPKIVFADAVETSKTSILVGEFAKILKQNGIDIGQNRLFEWLREKEYLIKKKGKNSNVPTQKGMDLGLFEIKETPIMRSTGDIDLRITSKITGKGQIYFINKFKEATV